MFRFKLLYPFFYMILFVFASPSKTLAQTQGMYYPDTLSKEEVAKVIDTIGNPALKRYLQFLQTEWDTTPQAFLATFQGFSMGDYPHLIFEGKDGISYDFGDGANELGEYAKDFLGETDSKWIGHSFKIYWSWKRSNFYCCEGEMEVVETWIPSIVRLILIAP